MPSGNKRLATGNSARGSSKEMNREQGTFFEQPKPGAVWYQFYGPQGQPTGNSVKLILTESICDIDDFVKRVVQDNPSRFKDVGPSDLCVYQNLEALRENKRLTGGLLISDFYNISTDPLIMAPFQVEPRGADKFYLTLQSEVGPSQQNPVGQYSAIADRILRDPKAKEYIDSLWNALLDGTNRRAFNALCVPSGTGKTQLAFSLPRDKCECIYFNMAAGRKNNNEQLVYQAFQEYMGGVMDIVKRGYANSKSGYQWIYGLIIALLKLLRNHPELRLPDDLPRLRVTENPLSSAIDTEVIEEAADIDVQREICNWSETKRGKKLVLFVDEFTPTDSITQEQLAFFRRTLMDTGACVIVASTDSGAMNMFNPAAATKTSRQSGEPWVNLFTQLPAYVPEAELRAAVDECENLDVRTVMDLCIRSRPLFAHAVSGQIKEYLSTQQSHNFADILKTVEGFRETLITVLQTKNQSFEESGCFGYVMALLFAGRALISGNENHMRAFGNLNTKNWAYLVDDVEVLKQKLIDTLAGPKRQKLVGKDYVKSFSVIRETATSLFLYRRGGNKGGKDYLELYFNGTKYPFSCTTFLPKPDEDFLLSLVLAGSSSRPGLYVRNHEGRQVRISVAKLLLNVLEGNNRLPPSANALNPDSSYHESLVCAAFITACNSGSLTGCSLEELVTRFVAELMIPSDAEYSELQTLPKIKWNGNFRARFAFPFDTAVPREVHEILSTTQTSRPSPDKCIDAVAFDPPDMINYNVIVEAKSTTNPGYVKDAIQEALDRQDTHANVSFIVADKESTLKLEFESTRSGVRNRKKKVGRKLAISGALDANIFYVKVQKNVKVGSGPKVTLESINKHPVNVAAEKLIFVICCDDINRIYQPK